MQPRAIVPQDRAVISDTFTQSVILFYPLCFLYLGAAPVFFSLCFRLFFVVFSVTVSVEYSLLHCAMLVTILSGRILTLSHERAHGTPGLSS